MELKEITKEELTKDYEHNLTVGDLREFLSRYNLPNTAKVLIQRVEDFYYERNNWGVYLKKGLHTYEDDNGNIVKSSMDQYHPAWSCVKYKDEDDILFIDLHY